MKYAGGPILALDLAGRTGFAIGEPASKPDFGFHDLPVTGDAIGRYAYAFEDWLTSIIEDRWPTAIIYEQPSTFKQTTPATTIKLNGLAYHTELICYRRSIGVAKVNPSKLKKFWTGSGRAQKEDMVRAARARGFAVLDDNVADALAIWVYSALTLAPEHAQRFALGPLGATAA